MSLKEEGVISVQHVAAQTDEESQLANVSVKWEDISASDTESGTTDGKPWLDEGQC